MDACRYNGDIHTVKALVKAGCDIRETSKNNENAVDIAASCGDNNVRDYLREALKQTDKFSSSELQKKYKNDEKQQLVKTCAARGFVGGNFEFGKSSLVRSLISNGPYLMDEEDRTVVVDIRLWNISKDVTVPMYDIGGHPCYQQVAHLFHSDAVNNINVIPHDITSDDYVTTYQWVTDVLMRSPESTLELVLTKSDKISKDNREKMKYQFTTYMKSHLEADCQMALEKAKRRQGILHEKQKIIDKYKEIARNIETHVYIVSCKVKGDPGFNNFRDAIIKKIKSDKFKVKLPASTFQLYRYLGKLGVEKKQRKIIQPISPLNEQETQPATSLKGQKTQPATSLKKQETHQKTQPATSLKEQQTHQETQPATSSETMEKEKENKEQVQFITFEEAKEIMRRQVLRTKKDVTKKLKKCLRCLHQNGLLLWFEHSVDLKELIFNDIGSFVNLLKALFHHDLDEVFSYDASITRQITKPTYDNYMRQLREEGLLSVHLLSVFAKRFTLQEHVNGLIDILIYLNIAIKTDKPDYVYFPWYVEKTPEKYEQMIKDVKSTDLNSHCLHLRLSGSIPSAFFNYFTVSMFKYLDPASTSQARKVWKDRFLAKINEASIYLENRIKNQIDIYIKSPVDKKSVNKGWSIAKHSDKEIKKLIEEWWPGMMAELFLICRHCEDPILTTSADCTNIHHWQLNDIFSKHCGKDVCYCPNDIEVSIPSVLIHPLPQDDAVAKECLGELRQYLGKHRTDQGDGERGQEVNQGRVEHDLSIPPQVQHVELNYSNPMQVRPKEHKASTQVYRSTKISKPFRNLGRRPKTVFKKEEKQTSIEDANADRPFPTDIQMLELAKGIGAEKLEMAAYLGISIPEVERIEMDHVRNELNQIRAILVSWRDRSSLDPEQRCSELRHCFRQCGKERLAVKVQQFYEEHHPQITEASTSTPTGSLDQGTHASPAIPRHSVMQDKDIEPITTRDIELTPSQSQRSIPEEEVQRQDHKCCTVL